MESLTFSNDDYKKRSLKMVSVADLEKNGSLRKTLVVNCIAVGKKRTRANHIL